MSKGEIIITIQADGSTHIEVSGVKGKICGSITESLEKSLGMVADKKKKPEYDLLGSSRLGNSATINR